MKKRKRSLLKGCRLRRGELTISTLADTGQQDRAYWHRQTPDARLVAMEIMRRINYGEAAAGRIEKVLEITSLEVNQVIASQVNRETGRPRPENEDKPTF